MTSFAAPNALVLRLANALEEHGVSYCHWKSNTAIDRSESGDNDLDLLVARDDTARFHEVLSSLGFTRVEGTGKPQPPGKEHFFGYDAASGRLIHIDAHYQLFLGHDRTKNYRLPLETAFLASAKRRRGLFPLPDPELEYVVFLTRMVLKYGIWDEVMWQRLRGRRAGLKPSEYDELVHLESIVDRTRLGEVVEEHAPWMVDGLLERCEALARGEVAVAERVEIGRRLHRHLAPYALHPEAVDGPLRVGRRAQLALQRRLGRDAKFRLASGGGIVAVIGGDGSGKSTAVSGLAEWLGADLDARTVHLGKPRWSGVTYGVRGALKLAALVSRAVPKQAGAGGSHSLLDEYRPVLWLACTARDRYLTFRRARRFGNAGGIVVSDRYPHPVLQSMDVPMIQAAAGPGPNGLVRKLQRLERSYHDRIDPPELLVVLRVDPETAARRKTDEPADYVRRRVAEVWDIDWEAASVPVVDATRSPEEVGAELRALIWDALR